MSRHFRNLSLKILIYFIVAATIGFLVFMPAEEIMKDVFEKHIEKPEVFCKISQHEFDDLQQFARENKIVSTDGKAFTEWNDEHHYVSMLIVRQNDAMCYNSFVSYNMTYTESDRDTFYWGSRDLPVHTYQLELADETCRVYFSGYFDMIYAPLRRLICLAISFLSFALSFFLMFKKNIDYIHDIEENVMAICNRDFSNTIKIRDNSELSSLASNINKMSNTINLYLLADEAKQKEKEHFVKSIAHDIRTPLTAVIGYLELMKLPDIELKQRDYFLERALDKANHIRILTDDLFALEDNYQNQQCENYDGNELITRVQTSVKNYLDGKGIRYVSKNDIDFKFDIKANATLLLRVADNICSNISKHANVEEPVRFRIYTEDCELIICQQNRIKKPLDNDSKDLNTGYGLKICSKIIESMQGKMKAEILGDYFYLTIRIPVKER